MLQHMYNLQFKFSNVLQPTIECLINCDHMIGLSFDFNKRVSMGLTVNRQKRNIFYRQPSNERAKISRQISFLNNFFFTFFNFLNNFC